MQFCPKNQKIKHIEKIEKPLHNSDLRLSIIIKNFV